MPTACQFRTVHCRCLGQARSGARHFHGWIRWPPGLFARRQKTLLDLEPRIRREIPTLPGGLEPPGGAGSPPGIARARHLCRRVARLAPARKLRLEVAQTGSASACRRLRAGNSHRRFAGRGRLSRLRGPRRPIDRHERCPVCGGIHRGPVAPRRFQTGRQK